MLEGQSGSCAWAGLSVLPESETSAVSDGAGPLWPWLWPESVETLTPRYMRKAQVAGVPGFADKALLERWQSADKAQKRAQLHRTGETKPKSETSAVSDTEQPDVATKVQLREEGKERQEELKALELKGETRENSVLLESARPMCRRWQ